jgi:hypothetical protein
LRISSLRLVSPCPSSGLPSNATSSNMKGQAVFSRRYVACPPQAKLPRRYRTTASIWRSGLRSWTIHPIGSRAGR